MTIYAQRCMRRLHKFHAAFCCSMVNKHASVIDKSDCYHLRVMQINCVSKQKKKAKKGSFNSHPRSHSQLRFARSYFAAPHRHVATSNDKKCCSPKPSWPAGTQGPRARWFHLCERAEQANLYMYTHKRI